MTAAERDELIVAHLARARGVAKKMYFHIARRMPLDDLEQYGAMGLIDAAAKFDPARGAKFWTHAEHRVRGAILDGIRSETHFRSGLDRLPIEWVGLDVAIWECADEAAEHAMLALEAAIDSGRLLKRCTKIQRQVLTGVYLQGRYKEEIAPGMGFHASRLSQIETEACARLRAAA